MGARGTASGPDDDATMLFGRFTLSPALRELRHDGVLVTLGPRTIDLLLLLAGRAGDVVGKDEIAEHLWPGDAREHGRLRAHVAALRRVLGDGVTGPRYIVNVLGRGYVFVGAVRRLQDDAPRPAAPGRALQIVGREATIASLAAQVTRRRLVSIVGAGGLGKSTTALAVAAAVARHFPDGVVCLDLAGLADECALAAALAQALGHAGSTRSPVALLGARRVLLVLDNCGHLPDPTALLAERVLDECAQTHVLVTSREALCVRGEWVHRLAPLADAALDLFVARAGGGVPESAARALCERLDGNPLAIALAAAYSRRVGIDVLAAHPELLFAPDACADWPCAPRHRTLAATLDWSWRLLAPQEQIVLQRLAGLHTPFTLGQAGQACACPRIDATAVVDSVLTLGQRSLVEMDDAGTPARYRLTTVTRLYAGRADPP